MKIRNFNSILFNTHYNTGLVNFKLFLEIEYYTLSSSTTKRKEELEENIYLK